MALPAVPVTTDVTAALNAVTPAAMLLASLLVLHVTQAAPALPHPPVSAPSRSARSSSSSSSSSSLSSPAEDSQSLPPSLLPDDWSRSRSEPVSVQRRQSFVRCTGWGAGCTHVAYAVQPPSYGAGEARRYSQPTPVLRSRGRFRTSASGGGSGRRSPSSRSHYGLGFLFTSGTTWGANGKRSSPTYSREDTLNSLRAIISELQWLRRLTSQ